MFAGEEAGQIRCCQISPAHELTLLSTRPALGGSVSACYECACVFVRG
jgi:hypothetical protein